MTAQATQGPDQAAEPMSGEPPALPSRQRVAAAGALIVLLAFAVRLWGMAGPLPFIYHPDEQTTLEIVQTMIVERDPNPHFFEWPSLPLYLQTIAIGARFAVGKVTGEIDWTGERPLAVQQTGGNSITADETSVVVGRSLTVVFSVGIVILVFAVALAITRRIWVGAIAGALAGLEPLLVENARFLTNDTYAAFFALLAIAMSLLIYRRGALWHYAAAGAAAGAAASSKYNVVLVVVAIAVAHLLRHRRRFFTAPGIYVAAGASIAVFLLTTPAFLFAPSEVLDGLRIVGDHYSEGHAGAEGGSLSFYLTTLRASSGWLLLFVPLAFVPKQQRAYALILLVYPVAHLAFSTRYAVRFTRILLPVIPPLLILVALGVFGTWVLATRLIGDRRGLGLVSMAGLAAAVALAAWSPAHLMVATGRSLQIDQRQEARQWIDENLEDGSRVIVESYSPWIDSTRFDVYPVTLALGTALPSDSTMDYLVLTRTGSGRFLAAPDRYPAEAEQYGALFDEWCEVATFGTRLWVTVLGRDC